MKRKTILLVLFTSFLFGHSHGQTLWNNNKTKIIDYCNAAITNRYLADIAAKDGAVRKNYVLIKASLVSNTFDRPLSYQALMELLKKDFAATSTKLCQPIHSIGINAKDLDQDMPDVDGQLVIDSINSRISPKIKGQFKTYGPFMDSLKSRLTTRFDTLIAREARVASAQASKGAKTSTTDTPDVSGNTPLHTKTGQQEHSFFDVPLWNFWELLIGVILVVPAIVSLLSLDRLNKQLNGRLDRHRGEINDLSQKIVPLVSKPPSELNPADFKRQVNMLIESNESLKSIHEALSGLSERISKQEGIARAREPEGLPMPVQPSTRPSAVTRNTDDSRVFYMSFPVSNYFPLNSKSNTSENTIYRFNPKSNGIEAEFELHILGGTPVSTLVSGVEEYIRPACNEENPPNIHARTIICTKPGIAVLEQDRWVIKDKATIRYE